MYCKPFMAYWARHGLVAVILVAFEVAYNFFSTEWAFSSYVLCLCMLHCSLFLLNLMAVANITTSNPTISATMRSIFDFTIKHYLFSLVKTIFFLQLPILSHYPITPRRYEIPKLLTFALSTRCIKTV